MLASDPCKLTGKEYQNLLTCPDEEFGKWFEAAWSWKEELPRPKKPERDLWPVTYFVLGLASAVQIVAAILALKSVLAW